MEGDSLTASIVDRIKRMPPLFWGTVGLPTCIAIIYYLLIASPVFVSQSKFVVRSPTKSTSTSLISQMVQGGGYANATSESYPVVAYITSRDALAELNKGDYIRKAYSGKGDFVSRFHGRIDPSFEALWRYYKSNIVSPVLDDESSIITLTTHAYTAKDAFDINENLLELSERLVNEMNHRATDDAVRFAKHEVVVAQEKAEEAAVALAVYRQTHAVFDPTHQSSLELQQVANLRQKLATVDAELSQLRKISPRSSQIYALSATEDAMRQQIRAQTAGVAGDSGSLSAKATEYTRLELASTFADHQVGSALASLELARQQAGRKQLYLERLVQPNVPDEAILPKRFKGILTTLITGLLAWAVLSLFLSSMREHKD